MSTLVGFTIYKNVAPESISALRRSHELVLSKFQHLERRSLMIGETSLELWGHKGSEECIHTLSDGSLAVIVGLPHQKNLWEHHENPLISGDFEIPWDGRVLLLLVSPAGRQWTLWNDWLGSIPVYHASPGQGCIASTLEPVVVAAAGYTPDDFFMPGLVSLLLNGHFISDWTLYKGMKVIPPDSKVIWDEKGYRTKMLWTVLPSQDRWDAGWHDLVDEMHELSVRAIRDALSSRPAWMLPLSSGLDSRLIAGVAADVGANVQAYTWGDANSTDVNYSRRIAQILGIPWQHIKLRNDYLVEYTPRWASQFGSAMSFHGMYQMCFYDALIGSAGAPIISGFLGDVISGDGIGDALPVHYKSSSYRIGSEWYSSWQEEGLKSLLKVPYKEALEENYLEIKKMIEGLPGAFYQKMILLEAWNRQRLFISFQATLKDYWHGVATPYLNRQYARFCLSLPRAVMDDRRLLTDVFRRYYGRLAVVPGTYANDPIILTGKYLILRRLAQWLLPALHRGPLRGFGNVQIRMDIHSVQTIGKAALWPLFENTGILAEWLNMAVLEKDYQTIARSKEDIRPLRRLQSVQALAYTLMKEQFTAV